MSGTTIPVRISLRSDMGLLLLATARAGAYKVTRLFIFGFWRRRTEKLPAPIFTIYTSNDVVSRKDVPFGGPENKISHLDPSPPKKKPANLWPIFDGTWENFASKRP